MFGIEKDIQNLMEQIYGPLNKDKMTEPKKCDIWITQGNPTKLYCFACNKTFATLDMPMTTEVLKSVCDAYEERCSMFTREELEND